MKKRRNIGLIVTLGIVGVVIVIAMILFFGWIGVRNTLVGLEEDTKGKWAQVENQLQRRLDLIPNLVETVKGYAAHEKDVFVQVTEARAGVAGAKSVSEKIDANNQLTSALSRLLVVVERYPELKANSNFLALQDELAGTENRIAVERKRYNESVRSFNSTRRKFPYMLLAAEFPMVPYFEAEEAAKKAPQVKF